MLREALKDWAGLLDGHWGKNTRKFKNLILIFKAKAHPNFVAVMAACNCLISKIEFSY